MNVIVGKPIDLSMRVGLLDEFERAVMYLLGLGLVLLLMKVLGWGPMAGLDWWWVGAPFVLAVAWWAWADSSGYTKRKVMEREDKKCDARRERTKEALSSINRNRR